MHNDTVVVTFMNGPADGRSMIIHATSVSVGRGSDHDVAIDFDPGVVCNHLEIIRQQDQWQLVVSDRARNVQVNGQRLYGQVVLTPDSLVRLSDTLLRIIVHSACEY